MRQARHQLLADALRDPSHDSQTSLRTKFRLSAGGLLRPDAPAVSLAVLANALRPPPQGDDKLALILSQEAKRLQALDRYERRALSRRNRAVQEFDCTVACKWVKRNGHN